MKTLFQKERKKRLGFKAKENDVVGAQFYISGASPNDVVLQTGGDAKSSQHK